ncbi:MAG: amidohydrolase family protein, partial [Pseudomonadota bacterium]
IEVDAGDDLVGGRLAGAHLSMIDAVRNMIRLTGVSTGEAIRMASATPAHALGLVGELGRIAPGYRAGLTLLDEGLGLLGVIVDGCRLD